MEEARHALMPDTQVFRDIFNASPIGIAVENLEGQPLFVNRAFCSMLGFTEEELRTKHYVDFSPPEDAEKDWALLQQLRAGSIDHYQLDKRYFRRDGSVVWGNLSVSLLNSRPCPLVLVMVTDITQRKQAEGALAESEERLRLAIQAGKMYAYEWDITTDVLVRSPEYVNVLAATEPQTLTHQQVLEHIHPDDRPKLLAAIARHSQENPTVEVTYRVLLPGKPPVWMKSSGRAFFDGEGRMLRVIGMVADVTDQKLAEEALRVSEGRLRLAQQAARIGTFERDVRTGRITWAEGLEPLYGLSPGSLDGKTPAFVKDLIHPTDRPRVAQLIQQALETGQPTEGEWRAIWPDGSVHWIVSRWQVLMDDSGEPLRVVGVNLDITERKRAEEAVKESETRFRLVADAAPVMIWMSGLDKKPTYFNQPWLDFTGLSETELQSRLAEIVHPADYQQCRDVYCRGFDQRQPFRKECRLRRHDGQYRWMLDIGVPRFHEDGSFAGYIGSCIDVTQHKQAEEAISAMARKLIESQEQERRRIARELHDDINQRVAMLAIEIERLERRPGVPSEIRKTAHEIAGRIKELCSDIQAVSHELHSSKLEYLGIVRGMKTWCREFGERQGMQIEFKNSGSFSSLPSQTSVCLFRVLQEALHNSVKHSGVKNVDVQLREEPGEVQLIVHDLGKGFDVAAAMQGRGLGVTSMLERVRLLGGTVTIDSKPHGGTTIYARIPLEAHQAQQAGL